MAAIATSSYAHSASYENGVSEIVGDKSVGELDFLMADLLLSELGIRLNK